jgi:hypothetical protein
MKRSKPATAITTSSRAKYATRVVPRQWPGQGEEKSRRRRSSAETDGPLLFFCFVVRCEIAALETTSVSDGFRPRSAIRRQRGRDGQPEMEMRVRNVFRPVKKVSEARRARERRAQAYVFSTSSEADERNAAYEPFSPACYVPTFQEERYFSCSSDSRSMRIPMLESLRVATQSSTDFGTS